MTQKMEGFDESKIVKIVPEIRKNSSHIGDIDGLSVYKWKYQNDNYILSLYKENEFLSLLNLKSSENFHILFIAYTVPKYRNQNHSKRLLYFLKNKLSIPIIDYGALTIDGINFYKSLNKDPRFDIKWFNNKTKEKRKFEISDEYISNSVTNWRVIIEKDLETILPLFETNLFPYKVFN